MFYGYIDINKKNLKKNYQKFFVKTLDDKWFLVDKILRDNSLELYNSNLKNIGIIKSFYLPKNNEFKNISYDESRYWQTKVLYENDDTYVFTDINDKIFNYEFNLLKNY
jgi:uncharacterized protein (UPF0128 family)